MTILKQINESATDITKLISQYKKSDVEDKDKLRDSISNDLEMLEYSPADVEKYTIKILAAISK